MSPCGSNVSTPFDQVANVRFLLSNLPSVKRTSEPVQSLNRLPRTAALGEVAGVVPRGTERHGSDAGMPAAMTLRLSILLLSLGPIILTLCPSASSKASV